jgi:hypothetical protein
VHWRNYRLREMVIATAFAVLLCSTVKAQENSQPRRGIRTPLQKISAQQQPNSQDLAFRVNPFAQALRKNSHAFAASVPVDLAAELANVSLSPTSGRIYSFPALAHPTFLGRSSHEQWPFPNVAAPELDTSRLRRAKVPDFTKNK